MVVIRLARMGRKGAPVYQVTVAEKGAKLTGKFIERLGVYRPSKDKSKTFVQLDLERFSHWVKLGAQASERVVKLLKNHPTGAAGTSARVS